MKEKIRTSTSGITLIALVITVILLVILATISINAIIGPDGLIERAEKAGELHEKAQEVERLELVKGEVALESAQKGQGGKFTVEEYVQALEEKGMLAKTLEAGTGDESQTIVTDSGWVITIEQNGARDVRIEVTEKFTGSIPKPTIKITGITVTSSLKDKSLKIDVTAKNEDGATYTYYYKKESDPDSSYKEIATGITGTTYTIDGKNAETPLEVGTIYRIKVVAKKGSDETSECTTTAKIDKIKEGLITFTNLTWSSEHDGTASIKINLSSTAPEGAELKYKILDIGDTSETTGGTLITSGGIVNNIQVGKKVIAWIEVGEEKSSPAEIDITENVSPNAGIAFSEKEMVTGGSITATVTLIDNESGIDDTNSKWVLTTENSSLGITDADLSKYTGGTLEGATQDTTNKTNWTKELTISSTTEGTYYLHVLTQDRAGNRKETISGEIEVTAPIEVTGLKIKVIERNGTAVTPEEIAEGSGVIISKNGTIKLDVIYNPGGEQPSDTLKGVTWSIDNTSYVTLNTTDNPGLVTVNTGITSGTATITATSTSKTSVKATCTIFVSEATLSYTWEELEEIAKAISATSDTDLPPDTSEHQITGTLNVAPDGTVTKGEKATGKNVAIGDTTYVKFKDDREGVSDYHLVRIVGFKHDLLAEDGYNTGYTPKKSTEEGTKKYAGITFVFANCIMNNIPMNSEAETTWETSDMKNTTLPGFVSKIENKTDGQKGLNMKKIYKLTWNGYSTGNMEENVENKLWLFSFWEAKGSNREFSFSTDTSHEGEPYVERRWRCVFEV